MPRHTAESLMLIRKRMQLDQEEFGKLIGVARAYVSRLENGHFEISATVSERLDELVAKHNIYVIPSPQDEGFAEDQVVYGGKAVGPTRAQIEGHIARFLDQAALRPGGLEAAWCLARVHFTPAALEAMASDGISEAARVKYDQLKARAAQMRDEQRGEDRGTKAS